MDLKEWAKGAVITVLIGGSVYTVSQGDIIKNFAEDTGLTQQQAEQYVNAVDENDLAPFDEIGANLVSEGQELLTIATEIDCENYEYEWESTVLSCQKGKAQISKLGEDFVSLGKAYIVLASDSASKTDISVTISLIDQVNSDFEFEVVNAVMDWATLDESKKTNSYNKAILKAAIESN